MTGRRHIGPGYRPDLWRPPQTHKIPARKSIPESPMTASLLKAFDQASHLPKAAQEQLAAQLLDDIKGELKWDQTLADSQPLLEKMARKALDAHRNGKTIRKGFGFAPGELRELVEKGEADIARGDTLSLAQLRKHFRR
jgi:2,4-dienoyl-CoA reductase-like NADH-dependent reductase (Old Yellow Enzyme family)